MCVCVCVSGELLFGRMHICLFRTRIVTAAACAYSVRPCVFNLVSVFMCTAPQVATQSVLALLYNDISVLESHHVSVMFRTLRREGCNPFPSLTSPAFAHFRKVSVNCILGTDMVHHADMVSTVQAMPSKVADAWPPGEVRSSHVCVCVRRARVSACMRLQ